MGTTSQQGAAASADHPAASGPLAGRAARVPLAAVIFVALGVVMGGQLAATLFPAVAWYLRDTLEAGLGTTALVGLGPFAAALLVPVVIRLLRPSGALLLTGMALVAARAAEFLLSDPQLGLWASAVGTTAFLWFLALVATRSRPAFVHGLLLGLAVDAALRAIRGTMPLSVEPGLVATGSGAVVAAVFLLLLLAVRLPRGRTGGWAWLGIPGDRTPRAAASLASVGPLLLLHWLVLHNQGWVAEVTGLPWSRAFGLIAAGDLLALAAAGLVMPREERGAITVLSGLLLLAAGALSGATPLVFGTAAFAAIVATGPFLAGTVAPVDPTRPSGAASGVWLAVGHIGLGIVVFAYYVGYEVDLPFSHGELRAAIGAAVAVGALLSVDVPRTGRRSALRPAFVGALVVVAAAATVAVRPSPQTTPGAATEPDGWPVRLMTYNVHSGFDVEGGPSLPEIARVVAQADVEVLALQEVSRGWLIDGRVDALGWLQRALDMPHVAFVATTDDPLWGLAVLSRYPITEIASGTLPRDGTLIRRGYLDVALDIGDEAPLHVIDTHLQHEAPRLTDLQIAQLEVLLDAWDGGERTVLVGDLNARPGTRPLRLLDRAGFIDAWAAGEGRGRTWPADDPDRRIDWVLHTDDLEAVEAQVLETTASDHRPVVAEIVPAGE